MLRKTRLLPVMFALVAGLSSFACGGSTEPVDPQQPGVTTTHTGLKVTAAISAASLGGSYANVQLAFMAEAGSEGASVEVVSVKLIDVARDSAIDTLEATSPRVWQGDGYAPWNQRVPAGGDLRASYTLTAPAWSKIDQGGTEGKTAYSRTFKLQVTLRIDGVDVLLQSTDLHREPQMQT